MQGSARSGSKSRGHTIMLGRGHVHAPRALDYGEIDAPCKMTYSRMAFFSRPCDSCETRAKIAAHVHAQQLQLSEEHD
jgi:hypothetical protein